VFGASRDLISSLRRHRHLAWVLARREIADRYAGQFFGAFWAFGHPLFLVGVYLFIFAFVFKVRLGTGDQDVGNYGLYMLSGLIPWLCVQEVLTRASVCVSSQSSLVKQVVFPVEVLPVRIVVAALCSQFIFCTAVGVYRAFAGSGVPWTMALLPLLIGIEAVGLVGIAVVLGGIGVFLRDMKDLIQAFCAVGLFAMPIAYQPDMVPEALRPILWINPFSYLVWCFQDVFYYGGIDHPWAWAILTGWSAVAFAVGARVFRILRPMFGGVL
jgi:lipopolysaccharide transport system permease protein